MFYASILYMKSLYAVDSMLKLLVIYKAFFLYVTVWYDNSSSLLIETIVELHVSCSCCVQ